MTATRIALLAIATLSCWTLSSRAFADPCSSITVPRDASRPLGTCLSDGAACATDGACTGHSRDYCIHGVSTTDSGAACYGGADCTGDITFFFDREYECGRFVNGDPWVRDEGEGVMVTRITPDHLPGCETGDECRHGFEVGQPVGAQSLSSFAAAFEARTPTLPMTFGASAGPLSLLKAIDARFEGGCYDRQNCFLHAALLTIVADTPPEDAFRPHFTDAAREDGYRTFCDVNLGLLPSLPVSMAPDGLDVEDASTFFSTPFLGKNGRNSSVQQNMTLYQSYLGSAGSASLVTGYHARRSTRTQDALLRLLLSDFDPEGNAEHRLALARAIQFGIDLSGLVREWGSSTRIKATAVPIAFSAFLLSDETLATTGFSGLSEMDTILDTPRAASGTGNVLWGHRDTEANYWSYVTTGRGNKWVGDPYGYVDPGPGYQTCCSSGSWVGGALVLELLRVPPLIGDLELGPFVEYIGRFRDFGFHTVPDPCAPAPPEAEGCSPPACPGYGESWGPAPGNAPDCHVSGTCECIGHDGDPTTDGRHPELHGTAGETFWGSGYAGDMWSAFHSCAADCSCPGMVCEPEANPCSGAPPTTEPPTADGGADGGAPDPDAGSDAAAGDGGMMPGEGDGGCGCRAHGTRREGGGPFVLAFALAIIARRRRRAMIAMRAKH